MEDHKSMEEGLGYKTSGNNKDVNEKIYEYQKEENTENDGQERKVAQAETNMQAIKDDEMPQASTILKPKTKRIATLDAFRGLTVVVNMIYWYITINFICMQC